MSFQALARTWRPRRFDQLVGQAHVVRALTHALDNNKLHHALLFSGTRGVGKTTLARIICKCLNCERGVSASPCVGEDACGTCREIDEGRYVDLIEVDAASRTGVDDTRDLMDNVQYAPTRGRTKVYLIDEVHMLTKHSFNALLKTLEEPPPRVQFLLATTEPEKIPVTILSRCLQFPLKRLPVAQIADRLRHIVGAESLSADDDSLVEIARGADGSMRDGLSLLDQAIAFGGGHLAVDDVRDMLGTIGEARVAELVDAIIGAQAVNALTAVEALYAQGIDMRYLLEAMATAWQQIATIQIVGEAVDDESARWLASAQQADAATTQLFYDITLAGLRDFVHAPDPLVGVKMTVLRMLAFAPSGDTQASAGPVGSAPPSIAPHKPSQPAAPSGPPAPSEPSTASAVPASISTTSQSAGQAPSTTAQSSPGARHSGLEAMAKAREQLSGKKTTRAAPQVQASKPQSTAGSHQGATSPASLSYVDETHGLSQPTTGPADDKTNGEASVQSQASETPPPEVQDTTAPTPADDAGINPSLDGLAGQDASAGDGQHVETKHEAPVAKAQASAPMWDVESPVPEHEPAVEHQSADSPAIDQPSINGHEATSAAEPVAHDTAFSNSATTDHPEDWHALLPKLDVQGFAAQLASNGVCRHMDGERIELELARANAFLATDGARETLQHALAQVWQSAQVPHIQVKVVDSVDDTPAQRIEANAEQRQLDAVASIENDPIVRQLQEQLGARLRRETIKPHRASQPPDDAPHQLRDEQ